MVQVLERARPFLKLLQSRLDAKARANRGLYEKARPFFGEWVYHLPWPEAGEKSNLVEAAFEAAWEYFESLEGRGVSRCPRLCVGLEDVPEFFRGYGNLIWNLAPLDPGSPSLLDTKLRELPQGQTYVLSDLMGWLKIEAWKHGLLQMRMAALDAAERVQNQQLQTLIRAELGGAGADLGTWKSVPWKKSTGGMEFGLGQALGVDVASGSWKYIGTFGRSAAQGGSLRGIPKVEVAALSWPGSKASGPGIWLSDGFQSGWLFADAFGASWVRLSGGSKPQAAQAAERASTASALSEEAKKMTAEALKRLPEAVLALGSTPSSVAALGHVVAVAFEHSYKVHLLAKGERAEGWKEY